MNGAMNDTRVWGGRPLIVGLAAGALALAACSDNGGAGSGDPTGGVAPTEGPVDPTTEPTQEPTPQEPTTQEPTTDPTAEPPSSEGLDEQALAAWEDFDADAAQRLGVPMRTFVARVADGGCIAEHVTDGDDPVLPVGTAGFGPVVLAVAEAVSDGELAWEEELTVGEEHLIHGQPAAAQAGDLVPVEDATRRFAVEGVPNSAQLVLDTLGTDRVEGVLAGLGVDPERAQPFLTPHQRWVLDLGDPAVLTQWAQADVQERRDILAGLPDLVDVADDAGPVPDDLWTYGADLFTTAEDLCTVQALVQQRGQQDELLRDVVADRRVELVPEEVDYYSGLYHAAEGTLARALYVELPEDEPGQGWSLVVRVADESLEVDVHEAQALADEALDLLVLQLTS